MDTLLTQLVEAAIQAPSGDDLQPWRITVDSTSRRIALYLDETRDPSPMNAGQRMSRMAVGAALENLVRAAHDLGLAAEVEMPSGKDAPLAVVQLTGEARPEASINPWIAARVTNRRVYNGQSLPPQIQNTLVEETTRMSGVRVHWVFDRDRISSLAELVGRGDALMFGVPAVRRAFLANVRFDVPANAEVDEGLSIGSLELGMGDRIALRMMPWLPDWLLRVAGAEGKFAAAAKRLVRSASGLCVLSQADLDPKTHLAVGRAMQSAWLAMASQRLAAQPMMSLVVLDNMQRQGSLPEKLDPSAIRGLLNELRALIPELADESPAFILRFGKAPEPTVRTRRLPLQANVREEAVA